MEEPSRSSDLLKEFTKERSIRRILRVLKAKRSRINEELNQLVTHLGLLVPLKHNKDDNDILLEALSRLDSDGFTELLEQIIKDSKP
ncbi:conserved hypothetical protein [Hyella patelloides LEGE 07179]|uniref:Uncharacterized protein n=1 Tax=Hyella patelloides LEGE 07179 TaxID=945734 RepID=A0A563W401_9CYAN|nr:hypothetical protein [Hyella patelloides]VEP18408.1 conserved hypothetical protein [Hyella patelloides LEGE 07179]